jgi:hypothetical protein
MRTSLLKGIGLLVMLAVVMLLPSVVRAQSATTGAIAGEVRDLTGLPLPGVTVEAASPALIEKVRTVVTGAAGRYQITELRPGTYAVTFTLPGFNTVRREGLELNTGFTATVNGDMRPGGIEETITVTGASPVVDVTNVRSQNVLTRDLLDTLPTSKSVQALAAVTLGAITTGALGGGEAGGSKGEPVFGFAQIHGSLNGTRTLDGMKLSSAYNVSLASRNQFNQMMVQEIVMETSAASAETESSGLNANMVPKDGGNQFHGSFNAEGTNNHFQSDNLNDELRLRGLTRTNSVRKIYDVGAGFGGPIKQDKLWFYTAARSWGSIEQLAGVFFNANQSALSPRNLSASNPPVYRADLSRPAFYDRYTKDASLRLTYQATEKQKFAFNGNVQDYCWCYSYFITNPEAAWHFHVYPNNNWMATWTYPATNRLLFQAGASLRQDRQFNGVPEEAGDAIPILDLSTLVAYGSRFVSTGIVGDTEYGDMGNQYAYQTRASISYITGSHAFRVGMQTMTGNSEIRSVAPLYDYQYILQNTVPVELKLGAYPHTQKGRLKLMLGLYAQDQWTVGRLTLNLGVRFDGLNAYNPAQTRPGGRFLGPISFDAVYNVPNWKDINPRLGAAYDLFGNGKTALKVSFGRYANYETTGLTKLTNPANALVAHTNRRWTDLNNDYIPDCDLANPAQNGECGPYLNRNFGTSIVTTKYSKDVTEGWHVRPWNKQTSAVVQHELAPGFGVTAGYYRTWYGNKQVTDNLLVTKADYTEYCVTAPVDSRLPGGGGYRVCGAYDVNASGAGKFDNLVVRAPKGTLTEVFNGIDLGMNWRFGRGGLLSGGVAFGRTGFDNCGVPDVPAQFCHFYMPWEGQTQIKLQGAHPLPFGFQASATYLGAPGLPQAATRAYTSAAIAPSLGRPLTNTSVQVVRILEPNTQFEDRYNQIDLRFSRPIRFGAVRVNPRFDIYNATNSAAVIGSIGGYGAAWLRPTDILTARLIKFGAQIDW